MNMNFFLIPAILFAFFHLSQAGPLRIQKRAAFYIANETACVVDNTVYNSGDPIPTDDPCEACRCRPPGFACVLKECESKPGCRAVRRAGQCCPEFICDSDNSTNIDFALPTEKPQTNEETTVSSKTSESPLSSEIPENIADTQVTKKENDKDSSEVLPPESLDSSLLFSANEGEESNKDTQTTKKDASSESVSDENSEEMLLDAAESSEESSSEKKIENVTEILNADFEIIKDEEKPTESEIIPEQGPSEGGAESRCRTTVEVPKTETLNYNSDAKVAPETVETVTTVVEVKEQTSSEKVDVETSSSPAVSNEPEQVLFKALSDVAEENNKQETTVKSNEVTTSQTTVEVSDSATSKVADISTPSSLSHPWKLGWGNKEKVAWEEQGEQTVPSTEAPKVSEGETSTTVVAEVSSEKVEPSKD
ncbi:hypothetical protein HNY73_013166 [Argiope bruennichi]|uniref:VWFC domain-containing protein n=1 Tax=Argiope bruennichi TaxID=94029 RepID=A0A8T0EX57_ARGBR|nr:hypothetical protein HNY73_013166 [Argiope bruennichi]